MVSFCWFHHFAWVINVKDKQYLKAFGQHLRELRKSKGISQEALEFESGLSKNQVGNIERGEVNTTISAVRLLAKALGVSPQDLFDFK